MKKTKTVRKVVKKAPKVSKPRKKAPVTTKAPATRLPKATERPQATAFWVGRPKADVHMDWPYTTDNWLEGYVQSAVHPHRDLLVDTLATFEPFGSLLEIGCSAGPNLIRIHQRFPHVILQGIDPNADSVEKAVSVVGGSNVQIEVGQAQALPFDTNKFDVVLADASLMYIEPSEIDVVMNEIARVSKKYIVIVDRFNKSKAGEVTGHVWGRNYTALLQDKGYTVQEIKMTKKLWPTSLNWQKYGRYFIGVK